MTAHTAYPEFDDSGLPATLSKPIITDILKGELGFKGVVTTDEITMGGIISKFEVKDACKYAQELDSTGGVKAKVAATPGAIGYVSLDVVDESIKAVSIDSVEPTEANIIAGDYLLSRPFVMATNGEISAQNDLVKGWFDYISSDAGKDVIKSVGLIIPQ